jgi:hypothetical protein
MTGDPPIIVHLRERLARYEAQDAGSRSDICATVVGRGVTRALGVRGEKVAENLDGTSTYLLTAAQVRRALARWDGRTEVGT